MKYYNIFKAIAGCTLALTVAGCGEQDSPNYYAFIVYPENRIVCSPGDNCKICAALGY